MASWKRVGPTDIQTIGWRNVVTKNFIMSDGNRAEIGTYNKENSHVVATIALTPENKVIIGRQFRGGPEKVMEDIPGGSVDDGEDLAMAAKRELLEETGYTAEKIQKIGFAHKDAYQNTTWHFFLATDCVHRPDGIKHDDIEDIEIKLISIDTLIDNAKKGRMVDPEAVLMALEKLQELKEVVYV